MVFKETKTIRAFTGDGALMFLVAPVGTDGALFDLELKTASGNWYRLVHTREELEGLSEAISRALDPSSAAPLWDRVTES